MTIGIYSLYWEKPDLIYIGQSQNIEKRLYEHCYMLKTNTHHNYKVQNAYNTYGSFTHNILEVCSIELLNYAEILWTEEFNSLSSLNGLNIVEAGSVGWGANSNNSKWSKATYLKVFSLLYKTSLTQEQISARAKVTPDLVKTIQSGRNHLWLKEQYPEKYLLVRSRIRNTPGILALYGKTAILVSPSGEEYSNITNVTKFCKDHIDLFPNYKAAALGISRVIADTAKQYKGWTKKKIADSG